HIPGRFLYEHERTPLYRLAGSHSLWERRIAVIATFYFIRRGDFGETFALSELLLDDREDLIHKAAGWMLREVGKRDMEAAEGFLAEHYRRMPRTMLRYAIERFPEELRQRYLRGGV
ncbi:MAG: DNA alkylation repair protein, partial [Chlorobiaceae bacterium]|nr:DNA alkylation repair protein [Chlorobiaceae bacterium]